VTAAVTTTPVTSAAVTATPVTAAAVTTAAPKSLAENSVIFLIIYADATKVGFNCVAKTTISTNAKAAIKANTKAASKSLVVYVA
jgi:hypothetical protein